MDIAELNRAKQLIQDIRLAKIINENNNFHERLYEAYLRVKELNIKSKSEFISRKVESGIGTFDYEEITFFERIQDPMYKKLVNEGWDMLHDLVDKYIAKQDIGDLLASTGNLDKVKKK